ncbi:MAG: hypothetical protein AB1649_19190 [Chloroflexota bacterium]
MSNEQSYDDLLKTVLDRVIQNNQQIRPGTPMAELKEAIEGALASLPPLEFEEFNQVLQNIDKNAASRLIERGPEMIGWNADQIVQWIEELSKKM